MLTGNTDPASARSAPAAMTTPAPPPLRPLRIVDRRPLTARIALFTLRPDDGGAPAPFTPGAHLALRTPCGAMRRYSLLDDAADGCYRIAVQREPDGRGGSRSLHDDADVGDVLPAEAPLNTFELVDAPAYLLIAGGIGITPILAMQRALARRDADYRLVYCTRSPERTAFLELLSTPALADRVTLHHDGGDPARAFDFWPLCETPGRRHLYCCGPPGLLDEIDALTGHWPRSAVHVEHFRPAEAPRADDRPFVVRVGEDGPALPVAADRTLLETLREAGYPTRSSCESGSCGTCRVRYLRGRVEHRDIVLNADQRDRYLMPCVSRAAADEDELVLAPP